MNGTEIVNHTRPEKLHLQTFHCACQIARATGQAGQTGSQGGIKSLDVGGIDTANLSLGLNQQTTCRGPVAMYQASLDMGQAFATVPFDHLNDVQFRPEDAPGSAPSAAILGSEQFLHHLGIGSKAIDSDQDRLDDATRSLTHLRHDLQDEMLVPVQRYSAPNEQAGKDAQCSADPGRMSLQLDPHFVGLYLGQLDCLAADVSLLDPFSMVSRSHLPTGHGAFIDTKGEYDSGQWTTVR